MKVFVVATTKSKYLLTGIINMNTTEAQVKERQPRILGKSRSTRKYAKVQEQTFINCHPVVMYFSLFVCRSTATGAGVGDENVTDTVKKVLPRREAEPERAVYQSCRGIVEIKCNIQGRCSFLES